jgi:hypothetical protein
MDWAVALLAFTILTLSPLILAAAFAPCFKAAHAKEARERADFDAFAARVGPRINPDRVSHLYYRLSPQGRDFIQNAREFAETEKGLSSRVVKWK